MSLIRRIWRRFRSAVTGRFVSRNYAEQHPAETVSERVDAAAVIERIRRERGE